MSIEQQVARIDERTEHIQRDIAEMNKRMASMEKWVSKLNSRQSVAESREAPPSEWYQNCPTTMIMEDHLEEHEKKNRRQLFWIGTMVTVIVFATNVVMRVVGL